MEISGQCYMVFLAVSPVSLTEMCSFWYSLRDLFSLHKLVDKKKSTISLFFFYYNKSKFSFLKFCSSQLHENLSP